MATVSLARSTQYPCPHVLHRNVTFADDGEQLVMGKIPENAVVVDAFAVVHTAFNDGSADVLDIGYIDVSGETDDPDEFATDIDLTTAGVIVDTALATAGVTRSTSGDMTVVCQYDGTTGDATAGEADVFVYYIVRNQAPDGVNS